MTFAVLALLGPVEATLTMTYTAVSNACPFKVTVQWNNVPLGSANYFSLKYKEGGSTADASCAAGQTSLGGTVSSASGTQAFSTQNACFNGGTKYIFWACDSDGASRSPTESPTPAFTAGTSSITRCSFTFNSASSNQNTATLMLAASHTDGTVSAPGLPSGNTIVLTSTAVTGSACDALKLTYSSWIPSSKTKHASLTSTATTPADNLEWAGSSQANTACIQAWKAANGQKAHIFFSDAFASRASASIDGTAGTSLGPSAGCAVTWTVGTPAPTPAPTSPTLVPTPAPPASATAPIWSSWCFPSILSLHVVYRALM